MNRYNLRTGDILIREKGGFFSKHHAVVYGWCYEFAQPIIAENQNNVGVRLISLDQFLNEGKLVKIKRGNYTFKAKQSIQKRINQRIGLAYNLFSYNCEHFANDVLRGISESKQIQNGIALGIAGTLLYMATRN